jgi:hypothetical protein
VGGVIFREGGTDNDTIGGQRVPIDVAITGLTITNGQSPYRPSVPSLPGGGGVYVSNYASLTLISSNVSSNRVTGNDGNGGGIYNAGTLTLIGSSVSGNSARVNGAGIDNDATEGGGTLTVTANSAISNNNGDGPPNQDPSPFGAGIYNNAGTVTITASAVTGNRVSGLSVGGGGIYNGGYLAISSSSISGNSSFSNSGSNSQGGALLNRGLAIVTLSTLNSNQATGGFGFDNRGGAILNGGTLSLTSCTLSSNYVQNIGGGGGGGGIWNRGRLTIEMSTFANNSAWQGVGCSWTPEVRPFRMTL